MSRPKSGRALFDLLSEDGEEVTEPLTQRGRWPRGDEPIARSTSSSGALTPSPLRLTDAREDAEAEVSVMALRNGRLHLALNAWSGAAVVFAGLTVLFAAWELGSRSGSEAAFQAGYDRGRASFEAEATSEIQKARAQMPASDLVADLTPGPVANRREAPAPPPETTADNPNWVRGFTYIVVQEFAAPNASNAEKAQAFLAERGLATSIVSLSGGRVQLITTQGYDHDDPSQKRANEDLLSKVHALGAEYFSSGGRYRLEGYFKKLTKNHW